MTSPRPSLASSTSVVSTSGSEGEIEEDVVPNVCPTLPVPVPAVPSTTKTKVTVNKVEVQKGADVPGVLNGHLVNAHVNFFINRTDEDEPVDVNGLVKHAVKINANTVKSFLPSDRNSANKLGTKEDVEGLSRKWCYLITALVILSLVTLLGTAVLSLTSWRTSQPPPALATDTPATQAVLASLSAEEKYFAGLAEGPRIVTRAMWKAAPPKHPLDKNLLPATLVVVCHTATPNCNSQQECSRRMRNMQEYHQETQDLEDLGYSFVIGGDGSVYWSNGFEFVGAFVAGYNSGSIGIAFVGNYINQTPNDGQIEAFEKLVKVGVKEGKISAGYSLVAACQLQVTASPGLTLVKKMETWPHFNSSLPLRCTRS